MSDQPVAEATQETNIHALSGIQTRDPSNKAAADLRSRSLGHRVSVQLMLCEIQVIFISCSVLCGSKFVSVGNVL
jgi:hypothetical protein